MLTAIQPDQILKELNQQWDQLDQEQAGSGGVLRACAMTLVVTTSGDAGTDDAGTDDVRRTLGELMHQHPSRAVIVKIKDGADFDARIFAECWKPFGSSQQICSEGVEILTDPARLDEAAQLMVPLKVPDLPVVLWCRGPAVFQLRYFDTLFPLANKIVVDSSTGTPASAALSLLRGLRSRGFRVADLHWTRLTGWRELLAHIFDDAALRAAGVATVRVDYGGNAPSTCARYFAAWIEDALPQARVSLAGRSGPAGLQSVTLSSSTGDVTLAREGDTIVVSGWGRHYRTPLPNKDEGQLVGDELRLLGPDPIFERILR